MANSMGYERALRLTLFHYHKTSADEARRYLEQMVKKHNFKNEARVSQIGLTWRSVSGSAPTNFAGSTSRLLMVTRMSTAPSIT
jgi:hypothetical protein